MSLLTILPKEIETIIHKYYYQLKYKNVMDELKLKVQYCSSCDEYKVNYKNDTCNHCCDFICCQCYRDSNIWHDGYEVNIECLQCHILEEYFNEETESEIAYAEEQLYIDMYGVQSMSQIY